MEPKKWEAPLKGSAEQKNIVELLKKFSSALRKIPLYPSTHPMVKDSILGLYLQIDEFFKTYGPLSIDVFEGNVLICEESLEDSQSLAKELISDFKKATVEGVRLEKGLTDLELENFLKIFSLKSDAVKEKGGMKAILAENKVTHITLNEVRYTRIKEEEVIKQKDEGLGPLGLQAKGQQKGEDIVSLVSDFFGGKTDVPPEKEVISYEFKKHSKRLVKQLLKLVGPEKAVDEVLKIIEDRFG